MADNYIELTTALVHALENNTNPVLSRYDDLASDPPSDPAASAALGETPYGTLESVKCKLEYQSRLDAFHAHLEKKCELYGILDIGFAKLEVTVFFLALLGMQSFLSRLKPELRDEIAEKVEKDLQDPWIARETGAIRKQMESVEGCCQEEGKCKNCNM